MRADLLWAVLLGRPLLHKITVTLQFLGFFWFLRALLPLTCFHLVLVCVRRMTVGYKLTGTVPHVEVKVRSAEEL